MIPPTMPLPSPEPPAAPRSAPLLPPWGLRDQVLAMLALGALVAGVWLHALPHHPAWWMSLQGALGAARPSFAAVWAGLNLIGEGLPLCIVVMALDRGQGDRLAGGLWCLPLSGLCVLLPEMFFAVPGPGWGLSSMIGEPLGGMIPLPSGHAWAASAVAAVLTTHSRPALANPSTLKSWLFEGGVLGGALGIAASGLAVGAPGPAGVLFGVGLGWCGGLFAAGLAQRSGAAAGLAAAMRGLRCCRLLAVIEVLLGCLLLWFSPGAALTAPVTWTLALVACLSASSRWRLGGHDPAGDAGAARLVLPVLGAGLLLTALLQGASWPALAAALRQVAWPLWLLAGLGMAGSYALRAERLRREWASWGRAHRPGGLHMGFAASLDIFLAHNAALVLLPMRAGEAGYPWLLKRRYGIPVADAVHSLVWLRLQDATVLVILALLLLLPAPPAWRVLAAGGAVLLLFALLPHLAAALSAHSARWQGLQAQLLAHRSDRAGWVFCAANWCLKLLVLGGLLSALSGLSGWSSWQGWAAAVAGELAMALPVQAPAGLGSYEAAIWAAGQWLSTDLPPSLLASAALAVHAFSLGAALGAFVLFQGAEGLRRRFGRRPPQPRIDPP